MRKHSFFVIQLIVSFIIFGTIFAVVQQFLRMDANDPQIQLAEDTAALLDEGTPPARLLGGKIDMARSLAPFTIIYDQRGKIVASNALLGDKTPKAPAGMLLAAKGKEYHAVTWAPRKDVRIASITVAANHYYVVSGRSLKEVEKREQQAMNIAVGGGVITGVVLFVGQYIAYRKTATALATRARSTPHRQS